MRLDESECWRRLASSDHGVLGTVHAERGVDAVPVCFAVFDGDVAVPIDRVKPKGTTPLQRVRNLARDGRAALLCEHWDRHDWDQLWWVRASLLQVADARAEAVTAECELRLRVKYPQYRDEEFAGLLVFEVVGLQGWSASGG